MEKRAGEPLVAAIFFPFYIEKEKDLDRVTLHLWSLRSGEDLDFHIPGLVKKWDLTNWLSHAVPQRDVPRGPQFVEQSLKIPHNAIGRSKNTRDAPAPARSERKAGSDGE